MKFLLLVLLLFPLSVVAGERFFVTEAGEVRMMDVPCPHNPKLMAGYLKPRTGKEMQGCWVFSSDVVFKLDESDFVIHQDWDHTYPVIDGSERKAPARIKRDGSRDVRAEEVSCKNS